MIFVLWREREREKRCVPHERCTASTCTHVSKQIVGRIKPFVLGAQFNGNSGNSFFSCVRLNPVVSGELSQRADNAPRSAIHGNCARIEWLALSQPNGTSQMLKSNTTDERNECERVKWRKALRSLYFYDIP